MKDRLVLRLHAMLFLFSMFWVLLGAPLTSAEWQDVPHRLKLMLVHLPGRMGSILLGWR